MTHPTTPTAQGAATIQPASPPPDIPEERTLVDRLRGYLPWIGGAIILIALFRAFAWWGEQQQRAALHGRAWPPEPIRVFFRG